MNESCDVWNEAQVVSISEASILACDDRPEKLFVPLRHFLERLQEDGLGADWSLSVE